MSGLCWDKYRMEAAAMRGSGGRRSGKRNWGAGQAETENRQDDADGGIDWQCRSGQVRLSAIERRTVDARPVIADSAQ